MSLAKIFGGGKKKTVEPTTQEAIQKLRNTEEMLTKKSEFLEKKIQVELLAAKKAGTKNKRVALAALKRKKRLEKQLQQIDNTLSTIEFQREAIENASTNIEAVKALDYGRKALSTAHKQLDVDDVNDLMDDISEEMQNANEIAEALSGMGGAFGDDIDEDELNAELEELEQEDLDEQMLNIGAVGEDLPSVPDTELPDVPTRSKEKKTVELDDDMAELTAWAS